MVLKVSTRWSRAETFRRPIDNKSYKKCSTRPPPFTEEALLAFSAAICCVEFTLPSKEFLFPPLLNFHLKLQCKPSEVLSFLFFHIHTRTHIFPVFIHVSPLLRDERNTHEPCFVSATTETNRSSSFEQISKNRFSLHFIFSIIFLLYTSLAQITLETHSFQSFLGFGLMKTHTAE